MHTDDSWSLRLPDWVEAKLTNRISACICGKILYFANAGPDHDKMGNPFPDLSQCGVLPVSGTSGS
jgi:hypothetical protein